MSADLLKEPICPLTENHGRKCLGPGCAWWHFDSAACAIVAVADELNGWSFGAERVEDARAGGGGSASWRISRLREAAANLRAKGDEDSAEAIDDLIAISIRAYEGAK